MMATTPAQVLAIWDAFEDADPDISTERLLAMTGDATGLDASGVIDALAAAGALTEY